MSFARHNVPVAAKLLLSLGGVVCGVVCGVCGSPAEAAPLFSYSSSTVSAANAPTIPSNPLGSSAVAFSNGLGFTTLNGASGLDAGAPGGTLFPFGNVQFDPLGGGNTPFAINFNYLVTITDTGSGNSQAVNFQGQISGTVNGTTGTISASYSNLTATPSGALLGGQSYSFAFDNAAVPVGTGSSGHGTLQARVSVPTTAGTAPEPASLGLLALAGLPVIGAGIRRRRV